MIDIVHFHSRLRNRHAAEWLFSGVELLKFIQVCDSAQCISEIPAAQLRPILPHIPPILARP